MVHERIIPLLHTHNFRDLGGYETVTGQTVKWGRIFRSDKLDQLSQQDQDRMVKLNIHVDIDLRSQEEITPSPDRLPDTIQYLFNPVFGQDLTDSSKNVEELDEALQSDPMAGCQHMMDVYHDMMTSEAAAQAFRVIFEQLLASPAAQGVLFHCTAGKDRTGMSAYFILRALGVNAEQAKKDYLITNTALKNFLNGQQAMFRAAGRSTVLIDNYVALWTADPRYLQTALTTLKEQYGDVEHYLNEALHLSKQDIQDLRKLYLN